jgi:hypothetical protein
MKRPARWVSLWMSLLILSALWFGCAPEAPLQVAPGMESVTLKVQGMT